MTKKTLNPRDDPPTASSSDDDEVHSSAGEEDEDDSSSEEAPSAAVTVAVPGKTAVTKQGSDSDSGSETETDSESETGSGKSMAVTVVATNPKKKEATLALPAMKSGTKRPSEGTSSNAKKKSKIGEDVKKPAFQRLWSEEDEIALLQGMIDFRDDTGKIPYEDTNGFYDYMKKSISVEVSKSQFMDKIRSLKKKYTGKGKNGKDVSFTKPHDVKSFGLSKFIWGPDGMGIESAKPNGISKKSKIKKLDSVKQELFLGNGKMVEEVDDDEVVVETGTTSDWFENSFLVGAIASFGVDEYTVKQRWSEASVEDKKKIEEKMTALRAKEIEYLLEKTKFLNDFASMIAEASK
ncbi:hypothetical protein AALP_AA2G026600 [Arabis alpina]|uniref:Uncharacterized protein n=1 Tax=Arabis alpina TaxID=50452 RepID=A0A087HEX3_ARAAL|nr:hypothetical protein AALP_AA2G026600 [Arabis alpina]